MVRGLLQLTWLEIKIFLREPLGAIGTIVIPVVVFLLIGRAMGGRAGSPQAAAFLRVDLPVLVAILIAISAVLSLVTIISIYREGGILKRLRATPLRPQAILMAHVLVKLLFTAITLALMVLAGRNYYPIGLEVPVVSFTLALLVSLLAILSMGFVVASLVPTARFAQPIGAVLFYPMIAVSGLFTPIEALPQGLRMLSRMLPMTYVVSLLQGILSGGSWWAHIADVAALAGVIAVCTAISARIFRWE